jgi:hypothetical protein
LTVNGSSNPPLQVYTPYDATNATQGGAIMSFHRGGRYAVNMGLDPDNVFRIGGWSAPSNLLQLDMSGNLTVAGLLRAGTNIYADGNYGYGLVGLYSSTKFQGVFAMGDSYKLAYDGSTTGSLYGLAWSYPSAGGQAGYLTSHGLLVMINGYTQVALSDSIWCIGNITAYSDARVKENVEVIDNAVEKIKSIRGVTYTRNDLSDTNKRYAGVIAQEVLKVLPEVVTEDIEGRYSVAYGNINALLIEAIKEQQEQIEKLTKIINKINENNSTGTNLG